MISPQKFYIQEISKKTNYRVNWLPDKVLNVGDVGKLEDGLFTLYTTLEQQGLPVSVSETKSSMNLNYTSNESVKISNGYMTEAVAAGFSEAPDKRICNVEFNKPDGVVFQISDYTALSMDNLKDVEDLILEKYKKGIWDLGWGVITEVVRTDSATIIINTGGSNKLEFEMNENADLKSENLADTGLGLQLLNETGTSTKFIAKDNLTPLYVVKGISDPLYGKSKFRGANAYRAIQFNALRELSFNPSEIV